MQELKERNHLPSYVIMESIKIKVNKSKESIIFGLLYVSCNFVLAMLVIHSIE